MKALAIWNWDFFKISYTDNSVLLVLTGIIDNNTEILSLLWNSFSAAVKLFRILFM